MDQNSQIYDPNKIIESEIDDFSILWNEYTQIHSKHMDTNLDDVDMNDELLDKLVTAILQDNTFDLDVNNESSNPPTQPQHSCNHEMLDSNSMGGVSDNALQVWQELMDGNNNLMEFSFTNKWNNKSPNNLAASQLLRQRDKSLPAEVVHHARIRTRSQSLQRANQSLSSKVDPNTSVLEKVTHRTGIRTRSQSLQRANQSRSSGVDTGTSVPEDVTHHARIRTRSQSIQRANQSLSSGVHGNTDFCPLSVDNRKTKSKTNSASRNSSLVYGNGTVTRSRSASLNSHSDTHPRLTVTPDSRVKYHLRSRNSADNKIEAKSSPRDQSRKTPKDRNEPSDNDQRSSSHKYLTRSQTSGNRVGGHGGKCCAKLAIVLRRARMSMIARLRYGRRSSIWLRSSRGSATPKRKLERRRLSIKKVQNASLSKNSHHAKSCSTRER